MTMVEYSRVRVQRLCVLVWCTYVRWHVVHACVVYLHTVVCSYLFGCVEGSVFVLWYMYTELRTRNHTNGFMHEKCF